MLTRLVLLGVFVGVIAVTSDASFSITGDGQTQQWCIASAQTPENVLQNALSWACEEGGADCSEIQQGQSCYEPDNLLSHASYAFNNYYQNFKNHGGSCYFNGAAVITAKNPSYNSCVYDLLS